MRGALRRINENDRTRLVRRYGHFADRIYRAEHIGDMREADEFRTVFVERFFEYGDVDAAVRAERHEMHLQPFAQCGGLPRDYHRVVLHVGEQDAIPFLQELLREALNYRIDAHGRPRSENYFFAMRGIDERTHIVAYPLVPRRRSFGERIDAAVYGSVLRPIERIHRPKYDGGLLRRRGIVEVDERLSPPPAGAAPGGGVLKWEVTAGG